MMPRHLRFGAVVSTLGLALLTSPATLASPAPADAVRAAFAKRARDVHPDSGGTGDGLTMTLLVDAREEVRLLPTLLVMANEDVGRDRRVRVADVRRRVDVVDRGCQVEAHL